MVRWWWCVWGGAIREACQGATRCGATLTAMYCPGFALRSNPHDLVLLQLQVRGGACAA